MKVLKKSVCLLLSLVLTVSLICVLPLSTSAAENTANGIPVLNINIDESAEGYGTISQMNESPDHSVECTGTVKLDIPGGYKGDYSDVALSGTGDLELEYIRGRGHTTWAEDKKPYKFKLKKSADLLGMGSNKHWVLLANAKDETLLRNRIVYHIGRALGLAYTPKMLPVDVVMNGGYIGSYYLAEQIRLGKTRVNIDELTGKDNLEPEVTGGYLLSYSPYPEEPEGNVLTTEKGLRFQGENPVFYSSDSTDELGTDAQKTYISDYLQKIENAVYGKDFKDDDGVSVWDYMDMQSTADYWWVQEFSKNVDSFRTDSTYLYKPRNGKVYWGPIWDFDLSLGRVFSETDGFYMSNNIDWLNKLRAECPEYQAMLRQRWTVLNGIINDIVKDGGLLDRYAAETKSSWKANKACWDNDNSASDFDFEINMLRTWLIERQSWINENMGTMLNKVYGTVKFVADGKTVQESPILLGSNIDGSVPEAPAKTGYVFQGWKNEDGSELELLYPVKDDTTIIGSYLSEKSITKATNIYFQGNEIYDDMLLRDQFQISYTLTPFGTNDKVVKWSSSNSEIAEVDSNGVVKEKKTGTVKITAALRTGLEKSFILHIISMAETPWLEPSKLQAEKSSVTLKEGQYTQVAVSINPKPCDPSLYYYSSSEKVAEVDSNGVVHALKEGTAVITVSSPNDVTVKYKVVVKSTKKNNTLTVKKSAKSIKAKNLKTKSRIVKPLRITKAKGAVTVKTISVRLGKKKIPIKRFKVTRKGKLIVKKGKYKKGIYKVKVSITAFGSAKYKPKTVNKTLSIKIR